MSALSLHGYVPESLTETTEKHTDQNGPQNTSYLYLDTVWGLGSCPWQCFKYEEEPIWPSLLFLKEFEDIIHVAYAHIIIYCKQREGEGEKESERVRNVEKISLTFLSTRIDFQARKV